MIVLVAVRKPSYSTATMKETNMRTLNEGHGG